MIINSLTNTKVKEWVKLKNSKYRNLSQTFLVEGEHLIIEANKAGLIISLIVLNYEKPLLDNFPIYQVNELIMKKISTNTSLNKQVGICRFKDTSEEIDSELLILDNIQDPANVGGIIRTAYCFGFNSVILSDDTVDIYNPKLIKASQGSVFHVNTLRVNLIEYLPILKDKGYQLLATNLNTDENIEDVLIPERYGLILGNEGQGISPEVLALADTHFIIPITNFDSLNVLSAASICLYELSKKEEVS